MSPDLFADDSNPSRQVTDTVQSFWLFRRPHCFQLRPSPKIDRWSRAPEGSCLALATVKGFTGICDGDLESK